MAGNLIDNKVENLSDLAQDSLEHKLIVKAMEMRSNAHCPYSKFRVGAATLTSSGAIVPGCNVENASYGLTLCAERVSICNAVAQGFNKFSAMAVCCDIKGSFKGPCGACRQTLIEFGQDWFLYLVKPNGEYVKINIGSLVPLAFCPSTLEEDRVAVDQ